MTRRYSESEVLLSAQRAFVGEISSEMRAISIHFSDDILIRVHHDGPWSSDSYEDFDASAVTCIVSDLPWSEEHGYPQVDLEFVRADSQSLLPMDGTYVFARKGTQWRQPNQP